MEVAYGGHGLGGGTLVLTFLRLSLVSIERGTALRFELHEFVMDALRMAWCRSVVVTMVLTLARDVVDPEEAIRFCKVKL